MLLKKYYRNTAWKRATSCQLCKLVHNLQRSLKELSGCPKLRRTPYTCNDIIGEEGTRLHVGTVEFLREEQAKFRAGERTKSDSFAMH